MQVVRPGLGPVLGGVRAGVGRNEAGLPARRRALVVITSQGLVITLAFVAEQLACCSALVVVKNEAVVVVAGLMAKVAEQGPVRFVDKHAHLFAVDLVRLGRVDRDDALGMPDTDMLFVNVRIRASVFLENEAQMTGIDR